MLYILFYCVLSVDFFVLLCLLKEGDVFLLFQDGVIVVIEGNCFFESLCDVFIMVYVLKEDIDVCGLGG